MTATAREVVDALRHRHGGYGWAYMEELRTGTGYELWGDVGCTWRAGRAETRTQRIDAFAINCFPSRGVIAVAYEVKVTKGDFRSELARPEKRRMAELLSTHAYFAAPAGLLDPAAVPVRWGLIEIDGLTTRIVRKAAARELQPWPYWFIASITRRANVAEEELAKERAEHHRVWLELLALRDTLKAEAR